jgi:hypothetical protein
VDLPRTMIPAFVPPGAWLNDVARSNELFVRYGKEIAKD